MNQVNETVKIKIDGKDKFFEIGVNGSKYGQIVESLIRKYGNETIQIGKTKDINLLRLMEKAHRHFEMVGYDSNKDILTLGNLS